MTAPANGQAGFATPALQFTKFPELPLEIRQEIFDWALPAAQVISISRYLQSLHHDGFFSFSNPGNQRFEWVANENAVVSPLLHVSREAREAVLQRYELALDGLLVKRPIYIDFHKDLIFLGTPAAFEWFSGEPYHSLHAHGPIHIPSYIARPTAAVQAFKAKIQNVACIGSYSQVRNFFLQCPSLRRLIVEHPDPHTLIRILHNPLVLSQLSSNIPAIETKFQEEWRKKHGTRNKTKLPMLKFIPENTTTMFLQEVKRYWSLTWTVKKRFGVTTFRRHVMVKKIRERAL